MAQPSGSLSIITFKLQYRDVLERTATPGWQTVDDDIPAKVRRFEVTRLRPGTFCLCLSVCLSVCYIPHPAIVIRINGDGGCRLWQPIQADSQPKSSGLVFGRRALGAVLHSSNEPGELSQWLCRDDNTINIVLAIIIIGVDQHYQSIETVCLIHISKVIKRVI